MPETLKSRSALCSSFLIDQGSDGGHVTFWVLQHRKVTRIWQRSRACFRVLMSRGITGPFETWKPGVTCA